MLDKNFLGVPKEGYRASNNPKKKMGPPDFEETKFQLTGQAQSLEIKLMGIGRILYAAAASTLSP